MHLKLVWGWFEIDTDTSLNHQGIIYPFVWLVQCKTNDMFYIKKKRKMKTKQKTLLIQLFFSPKRQKQIKGCTLDLLKEETIFFTSLIISALLITKHSFRLHHWKTSSADWKVTVGTNELLAGYMSAVLLADLSVWHVKRLWEWRFTTSFALSWRCVGFFYVPCVSEF